MKRPKYPGLFLLVISLGVMGTRASVTNAFTPGVLGPVPAAAILVSPSGTVGPNYSPTYIWNEVPGASWYYLWVNGPSGNVFKQWYQASAVCGGGTCAATPPITLAGGNHTWWVQTWNDAGYGPWSSAMNFSVSPPGAATLVSPSGATTDASPSFTWNHVTGATWHYLWVSRVNSDGSLTTVHNKWYQAPAVCSSVSCSIMPGVTLSSGNYRWWIQTWNGGGYGPWSSAMNFTMSMQSATYYVSPTGNDSNPGTQTSPWQTIQKAADTVGAGSTVFVLEGNYAERVKIIRSGSAGAPIEFQAQGLVVMQGFTVQANDVTIRDFEITNTPDDSQDGWGIWVKGSNCLIEDNYVHYATRGGILLFAQPGSEALSANCIVRNNRLYRNAMVGIDVQGKNHLIENNEVWGTIQYHPLWVNPPSYVDADGIRFFGSGHIFRGNYIHDISLDDPENINPHIDAFQTWDEDLVKAGNNCIFERNTIVLGRGTAGFQLAGGTHDLVIRNNIVRAFAGIRAYKRTQSPYTSPSNLFVLNNLFIGDLTYAPNDGPVGVTIQDATNIIVNNDIFIDQPNYVINVSSSSGIDVDYNMAYNSDGSDPRGPIGTPILHNLWGFNPLLVNPGVGDYHLQARSPAIDAGITLPIVINDYDGNVRPQGAAYDIGPYEYIQQ